MGLVLNCLDRENQVTIGGNTFTFAPKQVKMFYNNDISLAITMHRQHMGFSALPDDLEYLTLKTKTGELGEVAPEHKDAYNEARQAGISSYVENLRRLIYNEQVSLKMDLEKSNNKMDPRLLLSPKMLTNMEEVLKYQSRKEDAAATQLEKVKELEKKLEALK